MGMNFISLRTHLTQSMVTHRRFLGWATLVLGVAVIAFSLLFRYGTTITYTATSDEARAVEGPVLERSLPQRLRIPGIGIDTLFTEALGLTETNEIEVPVNYDTLGWYQFGPTPGEIGPAVVLGHVDSETGPAVFFNLGQLEVGDLLYIDRADGSTATFVVTELERPRQSGFPTARVYGDIDHAGLRLITCSGSFIRGQQRYTHNLIVYARLVEG